MALLQFPLLNSSIDENQENLIYKVKNKINDTKLITQNYQYRYDNVTVHDCCKLCYTEIVYYIIGFS